MISKTTRHRIGDDLVASKACRNPAFDFMIPHSDASPILSVQNLFRSLKHGVLSSLRRYLSAKTINSNKRNGSCSLNYSVTQSPFGRLRYPMNASNAAGVTSSRMISAFTLSLKLPKNAAWKYDDLNWWLPCRRWSASFLALLICLLHFGPAYCMSSLAGRVMHVDRKTYSSRRYPSVVNTGSMAV